MTPSGSSTLPLVALTLLGAGCGFGCGSPGFSSPASEPTPGSGAPTTPPGEVEAPAQAADEPPSIPLEVRYDLATHLARAELFEPEGVQVVDLGTVAGEQITLGGFRSDTRPGELDGRLVLFGERRALRLALPTREAGPVKVTLAARTFRPGRVRIYVDGEELEVETGELPEGYTLYRGIHEGPLEEGEHELLLRTPGSGRLPEGGRATVAIDWLRVGGSAPTFSTALPPSPEALAPAELPVRGLRIPSGAALAHTLRVPADARLRALRRGGRGRLSVTLDGDGISTRRAIEGLAEEEAPLDVDLSSLAGEVVRISLEAEGGAVDLLRPAIVAPASSEATAEEALETPRNVLVYLIDTLRADKLRAYEPSSRVRSPGVERFVEGAITFLSAHSQENWTKPSVATLLSALMPWEHTAVGGDSVLPSSVTLLPEILRERGFHTGCFIANGYVSDRFGFRRGWDSYRNYIREGRRTDAEFVAADALAWLDERPEEQPFFLYVHTIDPHVPYRPPDEFLAMYGDPGYRGPVDFRRDALMLEHIKGGSVRLGDDDKAHLEALYDGEISYHDIHFAAIMRGLERRGLDDDTLVVVTSDHGEEFWDHGSVGHGHNVYEELLHVPLFFRHPGLSEGRARIERPVGLVDVVPTILESLELPIPEEMSGRSFLDAMRGEVEDAPASTVSGFMNNWRTIVVDGYKLIVRPGNRQRLYDLREDPNEENDLADARPITVRYLKGLLGVRLSESGEARQAARRHRRRRHRPERTTIDAETAAQLRALGYVH